MEKIIDFDIENIQEPFREKFYYARLKVVSCIISNLENIVASKLEEPLESLHKNNRSFIKVIYKEIYELNLEREILLKKLIFLSPRKKENQNYKNKF